MHDKQWENFTLLTPTWCLSKLGESLDVCCLQGKGYLYFAYPVGVSRGAWELLWMFYSRDAAAKSVTIQLKRL
jgi:hypothetical protein